MCGLYTLLRLRSAGASTAVVYGTAGVRAVVGPVPCACSSVGDAGFGGVSMPHALANGRGGWLSVGCVATTWEWALYCHHCARQGPWQAS